MKKMTFAVPVLLCSALLLTACGGTTTDTNDDTGGTSPTTEGTTPTTGTDKTGTDSTVATTEIKTISDFVDAWDELYNANEQVINEYEGMPIMELVTPALGFISGVQYDLLNMENEDGRFTGKLMLAGYQGFVEKRGTKMTFGYDDLREKDGWSDSQKAGDRLVENGSFDLAKLDYIVEDYTEREGVKLERNYYEFKKLSDGSIICLSLSGQSMNSSGNGVLTNDAIYLHNGVGQYDFVVANAFVGPEFTSVNFATSDMTKAQAIAAFKAAGYTITTSGGIKNGKLVLDPS